MTQKVIAWLGLLLALYFGIQGGEYSTTDLYRQRARERMLRASIDSLQHQLDSLAALRKRVLADPSIQERIARENFGMVRGTRELLYRFVDSDSLPDTLKAGRPGR
jgi:cell division protein FtsB